VHLAAQRRTESSAAELESEIDRREVALEVELVVDHEPSDE
jgi:hypothetical protein